MLLRLLGLRPFGLFLELASCFIAGIPWDEPADGTLSWAGSEPDRAMPEVSGEPPTPPEEWVIIRLQGGPHDGQLHTMPGTCQAWVCGHCRARYV